MSNFNDRLELMIAIKNVHDLLERATFQAYRAGISRDYLYDVIDDTWYDCYDEDCLFFYYQSTYNSFIDPDEDKL